MRPSWFQRIACAQTVKKHERASFARVNCTSVLLDRECYVFDSPLESFLFRKMRKNFHLDPRIHAWHKTKWNKKRWWVSGCLNDDLRAKSWTNSNQNVQFSRQIPPQRHSKNLENLNVLTCTARQQNEMSVHWNVSSHHNEFKTFSQ